MAVAGRALKCGRARSGHQHAALALGNHLPGGRPEAQESPLQIDSHDPAKFVQAHVDQRGSKTRYPCVGKKAIDPAHALKRPRESRFDLRFIAHISDQRVDFARRLVHERLTRGLGLVGLAAPDHDPRAGLKQAPRHGQANASIAAGNDCDPTGEIKHCRS